MGSRSGDGESSWRWGVNLEMRSRFGKEEWSLKWGAKLEMGESIWRWGVDLEMGSQVGDGESSWRLGVLAVVYLTTHQTISCLEMYPWTKMRQPTLWRGKLEMGNQVGNEMEMENELHLKLSNLKKYIE